MKKIMALYKQFVQHTKRFDWVALLVARIVIGLVFAQSGWGKFHHMPQVVDFFTSLGIPAAHIQAPIVAMLEFICGLLILFGLLTRAAAIPLVVIMLVALYTAKFPDLVTKWDVVAVNDFLYIVIMLVLVTYGPGKCSLDRKFIEKG